VAGLDDAVGFRRVFEREDVADACGHLAAGEAVAAVRDRHGTGTAVP
jgi:hypothetical protein